MRGEQQFTIAQPLATHFRPAECDEVECSNWQRGWVTVLDPAIHAERIRDLKESGRFYREMRSEDASQFLAKPLPAGLVAFVFPPGQMCFEAHRVPLEREPIFVHAKGGERRVHRNGRNFNEHFNEQSYRIGRARGVI